MKDIEHPEVNITLSRIRELLSEGLWSSAEFLCTSFLSSLGNHHDVKAQVMECLADSYFYRKDYHHALFNYSQTLILLKSVKRVTEVEMDAGRQIIFKKSKCLVEMNEPSKAVQELETIPSKNRTVEINMSIARLYHSTRLRRLAINAYKAVLAAEPLAIEVYEILLSLGVNANDLVDYLRNACQANVGCEWLASFLKMLTAKQGSDFDRCSSEYKNLKQIFPGNVICLLRVLAESAAMSDRPEEACEIFDLMMRVDEYAIENLADFGLILHEKRKVEKLNELVNTCLSINEHKDTGWLLAAMFCDLKEETEKAKMLVDRVLQMNPANICAHLFKGKLLLLNGQGEQALVSFHQANILRKDVRSFSLLINAQLAANKVKEATNSAKECLSLAPRAATSHVLMGHCFARAPTSQSMGDSIKAYQKALELDGKSIVAAASLAEALSTQDKNLEAVSILNKTLDMNGNNSETHRLRTQLARCYTRMENYAAAIEELHLVIELDPDHSEAIAELEKCEQLLSGR